MYFFFKYLENIIDNYLDLFFCSYYEFFDKNLNVFFLKNYFYEIKDVIKNFDILDLGFFFFSLKNVLFANEFLELLNKVLGLIWLYFYIISDILGVIFFYLGGHLLLSNKLYKDYVFNKHRRAMLVLLNTYFVFFLFLFLVFLLF